MSIPFAEEAKRHFDSVAERLGLACTVATAWAIRYENDAGFMNINFDNGRSYELGVEIGRKRVGYPEQPFTLGELLRSRRATEAPHAEGIYVTDPANLSQALARLAQLTSAHATDFFRGDKLSIARVLKVRNEEADQYLRDKRVGDAWAKSHSAWAGGDYRAVVQLLAPLEEFLSPAQRKRLNYCRKHLNT